VSEIVRWRRAHQPGGSNAGSVFTNPLGAAAAELVERCGLKGRRLGTAQVSPKHANFIQADEGGSADDVRRLVDLVRAEVADKAGVELVPELHMAGFADGGGLVVEAVEEPSTSSRGRG
jgi:UDP-N-acetylmuramate dehydrogenase